jgi:hypothetical protein
MRERRKRVFSLIGIRGDRHSRGATSLRMHGLIALNCHTVYLSERSDTNDVYQLKVGKRCIFQYSGVEGGHSSLASFVLLTFSAERTVPRYRSPRLLPL